MYFFKYFLLFLDYQGRFEPQTDHGTDSSAAMVPMLRYQLAARYLSPGRGHGIRYCAFAQTQRPATHSRCKHAEPLMVRAYLSERATSRSGCIPPLREGLGWVMLSFSSFLLRRKKRTDTFGSFQKEHLSQKKELSFPLINSFILLYQFK